MRKHAIAFADVAVFRLADRIPFNRPQRFPLSACDQADMGVAMERGEPKHQNVPRLCLLGREERVGPHRIYPRLHPPRLYRRRHTRFHQTRMDKRRAPWRAEGRPYGFEPGVNLGRPIAAVGTLSDIQILGCDLDGRKHYGSCADFAAAPAVNIASNLSRIVMRFGSKMT